MAYQPMIMAPLMIHNQPEVMWYPPTPIEGDIYSYHNIQQQPMEPMQQLMQQPMQQQFVP